MIRILVDPAHPEPDAIAQVADALLGGAVVAIPTDTLYGLAADPFNPKAVALVFEIKMRPVERALPLIAADLEQVRTWIGELPADAARLAGRFWPGPLTLVVRAPATLAPGVADARGTVAVRVPNHAAARALCRRVGRPLTATSANMTGEPPTHDPSRVQSALGGGGDARFLLDAGPTPGGQPSTIVDVTGDRPLLLREGAVSWSDIEQCLSRA